MMHRIGTAAALSLSVALVACGTDSTNPGPSPDAHVFDARPSTPDAGPGSDAGTPTADAGTPDAGAPALSGTIAIHSLQALDPTMGTPIGDRFGQINVSFGTSGTPLEAKSIPNGTFHTPCAAAIYAINDTGEGFNAGNVTFTITTTTGPGPTVPTCSFNTTTMAYDCGAVPQPDLIVDGDTVHVNYPATPPFAGYDDDLMAGKKPTLTTATVNLLKAPVDVSGDVDLTFAINETVDGTTGLAVVVVIDATDATTFTGATDIIGNATKSATMTCSVALSNTLVIPAAVVKVIGDVVPHKLRISIFHDASSLALLGTNTNIVVGQGYVEFQAPAAATKK